MFEWLCVCVCDQVWRYIHISLTLVEHGIEDWGMRQTSLEEVFVSIAKDAEEEFGMAYSIV
jgi:hypothetical protein